MTVQGSATKSDVLHLAGAMCCASLVPIRSWCPLRRAGRLLGLAPATPTVMEMIEDLLTPEDGFAVSERGVEPHVLGLSPRELPVIVLGVVRYGRLIRVGSPELGVIVADDRLLYLRLVAN